MCRVSLTATYLDMQTSMRLTDEPSPGAIRHDCFLPPPQSRMVWLKKAWSTMDCGVIVRFWASQKVGPQTLVIRAFTKGVLLV